MNDKYLDIVNRLNSLLNKYDFNIEVKTSDKFKIRLCCSYENYCKILGYNTGYNTSCIIPKRCVKLPTTPLYLWDDIEDCLFGPLMCQTKFQRYSVFNFVGYNYWPVLKSSLNNIKSSNIDEIIFNLDMLGI